MDNGNNAGTAVYDFPDNQKATIEVDRLELVVATRAFEVYQSEIDSAIDTLIIDQSGTSQAVTGTLDYNPNTNTHTVLGLLPSAGVTTGEALEAIEVRTGSGADAFTINTTNITTTIKTGGNADTINVETAAGAVHLFGEGGNDVINVKSFSTASTVHGGDEDDTINVSNNAGRLIGVGAKLFISGDAGSDTINANNASSNSTAAGTLTSTLLRGLKMPGEIEYDLTEVLNIHLGIANDTFTIENTHAGTTHVTGNLGADKFFVKTVAGFTDINTEEGNDTVTVTNNSTTLAGIQAILDIAAGAGSGDKLILDDSNAQQDQSGSFFADQLTGFGMTNGRIDHSGFDDVTLTLGDFVDDLTIESTIPGTTLIETGAGDDDVEIETYDGTTKLDTGIGSDKIFVFDGDGDAAGTGSFLEIDGGNDADLYEITAASQIAGISFIDLNDTGTSGIDELLYLGTTGNDLLQLDTVYDRSQDQDLEFTNDRWLPYGDHGEGLVIAHFDGNADQYVATDINDTESFTDDPEPTILNSGANLQIVNYSSIDLVTVFAGEGDDTIISDDTAQQMNVYGNGGKDQFFIGSVLETELVLVEGQEVAIVNEITRGASFKMNFYGGANNDYFEVNHNTADIGLFGDNGDDTFFIKALLTLNEDEDLVELDNKLTTVSGVSGEDSEASQTGNNDTRQIDVDSLVYVENANVKIDGGAGFDSVAIVGTVLSDTFYVFTEVEDGKTVQRIFGAGVKLRELLNIERIQLITGGGDDRVFVYGVDLGPVAELVINTGSGSDTIIVGGPELLIDLNFPKRSRTDFASVDGYQPAGETLVAFGLGIDLTESLDRVVPFNVEEPATTRQKMVPESRSLDAIVSPVLLTDADGIVDTLTINNQLGASALVFDDRELLKKAITTDSSRVVYPSNAGSGVTDLIAQLGDLASGDADEVRETVNDYLENLIVFADRYRDPALIQRLAVLPTDETESVTIEAGVSYAVFQDTLDENNQFVTGQSQLAAFLTGTGFTANFVDSAHPDPSRSDLISDLADITNGSGDELAFEAQYEEIIKDGQVFLDIIGVSLVTAAPVSLDIQASYILTVTPGDPEAWESVYVAGESPNIYFEKLEEVTVHLNTTQANTVVLDNTRYDGKTFVHGGVAADVFQVRGIAGQTFIHGDAGDDDFEIGEGTVAKLASDLFLHGDTGEDQVFVFNDQADATEVLVEKNTVQQTLEQDKLSKITNALEFTITDSTENQLIGDQLRIDSVPLAQQAAAPVDRR